MEDQRARSRSRPRYPDRTAPPWHAPAGAQPPHVHVIPPHGFPPGFHPPAKASPQHAAIVQAPHAPAGAQPPHVQHAAIVQARAALAAASAQASGIGRIVTGEAAARDQHGHETSGIGSSIPGDDRAALAASGIDPRHDPRAAATQGPTGDVSAMATQGASTHMGSAAAPPPTARTFEIAEASVFGNVRSSIRMESNAQQLCQYLLHGDWGSVKVLWSVEPGKVTCTTWIQDGDGNTISRQMNWADHAA